MTTLGEGDIEKLFSGAPQYFARSEGHFAGAPHPSVAFPFDEELEIRDLTDHVQIQDKAWGGITAWPHLTRDLNHDAAAKRQSQEKHRAHFHIRCRERPNMLSMQGLEKGTMGYQAALELAVGDSLEEEQFGFESVGTKVRAVVDARERMMSSSGWLRRIPELELVDRLKRNGELYRDNDLRKKKSIDTYTDLFHTFMRPGNFVIDKSDLYSLTNQINAIVKCLATANVWIDFSRVEWRIRLGQILWGRQDGDELNDPTPIHDATSARERAEEKYWLLMQIMLAAELLIRLDAVTEGHEAGGESFRPTDVAYFERNATQMVKWSLLLARSWLENIEVVKEERPATDKSTQSHTNRWLSSLASKISLHSSDQEDRPPSPPYQYSIRGRHGKRQVDGLTHFARKLRWPGIDTYEARISENVQNAVTLPTPAPTSAMKESKEAGYFGAWDVSHRDHHTEKVQTRRRRLAAALHSSGWLTKSYVFGLMLPGDVISHYLMATLLENDSHAMPKLGTFANLCGGFVYANKSFWSTSCIVGRVIAAGRGSAECMGWVSTDVVPRGFNDGWVNIEADDVPGDLSQTGKRARLWGKKRIEKESSIIGDGDEDSVLPADFILPQESVYSTPPPSVLVELEALVLSAPASVHATPLSELAPTASKDSNIPELLSYPAKLRFLVNTGENPEEVFTFSLVYDINFVTAHPCSPSQRVRFVKSPTSPTIQQIDVSGSDMLGRSTRPAHRMGHPLHKSFKYTVIHISELIQRREATLAQLLSPSDPNKQAASSGKGANNGVLVVDCITNFAEQALLPGLERVSTGSSWSSSPVAERSDSFSATAQMHLESRRRQFGSDMEILVRALCAEKGWNAIISRRKRGCLACAVREAGALGWKVLVRVE